MLKFNMENNVKGVPKKRLGLQRNIKHKFQVKKLVHKFIQLGLHLGQLLAEGVLRGQVVEDVARVHLLLQFLACS